jgi:hypothetical protein
MRRTPVALVPLAVAGLLAACSTERESTAPKAVAPAATASSLTLPACSFSTMRADARAFFDRSTDIAFDYISEMSRAAEPARTEAGWHVINEISTARLTGRQKTPWSTTAAAGEALALDVFACSQGIGDVSTVAAGSLGSAIFAGIFEVRGGSYTNAPAFGYLAVANEKAHSAPRYGVENRNGGTTWAGNPFLIVGVPTQYGPTYVPYATNINTNGVAKNGFDLFSIPLSQAKAGYVIGVCVPAVQTSNGTANMLIHAGVIQDQISPNQLCDEQIGALSSPSFFASLAKRAVAFLTPTAAHAQLLAEDYGGGGPTSWSPNVMGSVAGASVVLDFTAQSPLVANIGDNVHFEVTATINGQPVPDVVVTIGIDGNFGTPGLINGPTQAVTNASGVATFDVSFTKAGSTYVRSIGSLGGIATQTARSDQFWIRNK